MSAAGAGARSNPRKRSISRRLGRPQLSAFLVLFLTTASCTEPRTESPQLILIAWDGAADWVVDRLLAEGKLPNLARLAEQGVAAEHSMASFPAKTAVGFASLWTGCWPDCHGISANSVLEKPGLQHTLLETRRGFGAEALQAEPLFITAAKAGKRVAVLSATQSYPATPHLETLRLAGVPEDRYLSFSGFEHRIADAAMLDKAFLGPAELPWAGVETQGIAHGLRFRAGESAFIGLVFDAPENPIDGLDTVLIRQEETGLEVRLEPQPANDQLEGWSQPFPIRSGELDDNLVGNTFFRLFELAPDGSRLSLYQREASALSGAYKPDQLAQYLAAYPGFHDHPATLYRDGGLGSPLPLGGDGSAERRYLEIAAFDARLLEQGTRFVLENWDPDVLFHYSPATDSAGHLWGGLLDSRNPYYDPESAEPMWPIYSRIYQQLDDWLGVIITSARPGAIIAVVSDHGMAGSHRTVSLNRALQEADLLNQTDDGEIDLTRTKILAAESSFFLRVNTTAWKHGIVPLAEREGVIAAAAETLLALRDPATGQQIIPRVFHPNEAPAYSINGPARGDLYIETAAGYYPKNGLADTIVMPSLWAWGEGTHGYSPERRDMHAIFYAKGPGLASGLVSPPIRHIDVAPTLSHVIGIPAPPQARGQVIKEMMSRP